MQIPKFSIKDSAFSYAFSTSNWFKPTHFEWDFNNLHNNFIFFTDTNLANAFDPIYNGYKKYAWLVECEAICQYSYQFINQYGHLFDKIFTHSDKILQRENAYLLPIGGCHINEDEISLNYEKNELVSMVYSNKKYASGHALRHQVAEKIPHLINLMGPGFNEIRIEKIDSCKNYKFSIVIENSQSPHYFTEKIIDCFLTGTIPIYWGACKIGNYFDINGMLFFNSVEELEIMLADKNFLNKFYLSNSKAIKNNFELAKKYKICEDYLYETYKNIL